MRRRRRPRLALLLLAAAATLSVVSGAPDDSRLLQTAAAAARDGDGEDHDFSLRVGSGDGTDEDHDFSVPDVGTRAPETGGDADSPATPSASSESSDDEGESGLEPPMTTTPTAIPSEEDPDDEGSEAEEPTDMPVLEPTEKPTTAPVPRTPIATQAPTTTTPVTTHAPTRRPITLPTEKPSKEPAPTSSAPTTSAPTAKPARPITLPTDLPSEQPSPAPVTTTPHATTKTPDLSTDAPTRKPVVPITLPTVIPGKTPSPAPESVTPVAPVTTDAPTPTRKPVIPITLPTVVPAKTPSPEPEPATPDAPAPTRKPIIPIVLPTLIPVKTPSPTPKSATPGAPTIPVTTDPPTRKPIIPITRPTLIPVKTPTVSPSTGSGGADDPVIKSPASPPPSVAPGVVPTPPGSVPGNATIAPPHTRIPIDWDLIKNNNSTKRPGAGSGDGAGTVVAPTLGPAKTVPPANSPAPSKSNTTITTSAPVPTKTPAPTKKNQTVTKLEDSEDSEDAGTDTKSTSFKVNEKTTVTVTDGSKKQTYKKYDRNTMAELMKGDKSSPIATEHEDPSATDDSTALISGNVIGGSNRENPPPGADIEVSAFAAHAQDAIRYSSYAFSLVSFALLVAFHLLALKSPLWLIESASARRTSESWFMPATWELVAVMTYYQHLGSISMLELTKAPYIILDFTDSFSWMNFHVHSIVTSTTRRLEFIILTGIVSYSDRLGIDEGTLLETTTKFFVVLVVLVAVVFGAFAGLRVFGSRKNRESEAVGHSGSKWTAWKDSFAVCILGVGVAIWLIGVYPLITVSTYELTMQVRYQISGSIVLAMINMFIVVVAGLCFLFYKVRSIRAAAAFQYYNHGIYGTLYADSKQSFRYFFVGLVLFQAILGVLTGGIQDVPDQLVALLVAHVLFTAVLVYLAPFVDKRVQILIVLLNVFRIVNLSMSFAFLTVSELETSSRAVVAHGFVVFNFIVVLLLFVRHIGIFVVALRKWTQNQSISDEKHSMLAPDVNAEAGQGFEAGPRLSTSIVRGPNNSMHC